LVVRADQLGNPFLFFTAHLEPIMPHHHTSNPTTRRVLLGLFSWAGCLGWLVAADVAAPLSWNDPLFAGVADSAPVTLANGGSISGKSFTDIGFNASLQCNGSATISHVRINSREGIRIAGDDPSLLVTIDRSWIEAAGVGADHADCIQPYAGPTGGRGSFTITNSTIRGYPGMTQGGVFVADNYIGTFTFENVVFWGGQVVLGIYPDVGGDQYVSLKDVYFVGPFSFAYQFDFHDVAGHVVHFTKWENVRYATIVKGVLVPGELIPSPRPVEPGSNHAPVASAQSASTSVNTARALTLAGTDIEGSALTYAIVVNPAHGTLTGSGSSRTYTPTAGYTGADSFTFTVNDGALSSTAAMVSITVTTVANTAPLVSAATATPSPVTGTTTALSATASDDAGETALIYTWTAAGPEAVAFSPNGSNAAKASTATFTKVGSYTLTVTAKDAANLTGTRTVAVTVSEASTSDAGSEKGSGGCGSGGGIASLIVVLFGLALRSYSADRRTLDHW
jgi:hypothetical protein